MAQVGDTVEIKKIGAVSYLHAKVTELDAEGNPSAFETLNLKSKVLAKDVMHIRTRVMKTTPKYKA